MSLSKWQYTNEAAASGTDYVKKGGFQMMGIWIALISGALMSIQGVFNTEVTKNTSVWVSASWVQFSALLTCLVIWGIADRQSLLGILQVQPKYTLLGG